MDIKEWIERLERTVEQGKLTPGIRDEAVVEWRKLVESVCNAPDPVAKFEEIKAALRRSPMNEAPLSRVWSHATNGNGFALLTAFRGDKDRKTNVSNNVRLAGEIRSAGYGYFWVDGVWEDPETKIQYPEDSILVVGNGDDARLIKDAARWRSVYNQDAVLVVPGTINKGKSAGDVTANLIWRSGSVDIKRGWNPNVAAQFFTQLRGRPGKFTFGESVWVSDPYHVLPSNWLHAMGLKWKSERTEQDEAARLEAEKRVASHVAEDNTLFPGSSSYGGVVGFVEPKVIHSAVHPKYGKIVVIHGPGPVSFEVKTDYITGGGFFDKQADALARAYQLEAE